MPQPRLGAASEVELGGDEFDGIVGIAGQFGEPGQVFLDENGFPGLQSQLEFRVDQFDQQSVAPRHRRKGSYLSPADHPAATRSRTD